MEGILVINKPKGITSYDVIRKVSKILGIKKIGHTGTLDPIATGVLVLTIGSYTKVSELLVSTDKEYIATAKLNILTDTLDTSGKEIAKGDKKIDRDTLEKVLNSYQKTYLQEVPIYSAVKVKGKKLYEYARNNEDVVLPKKEVTIKEIEPLEYNEDTFKFRCVVSKGTYIRSLIRDIGDSLGTCAVMSELNRTRQGKFTLDEAYSLEDIEKDNYKLLALDDVLEAEVIEVDYELFNKIKNGSKLENTFNIKDKVIFKYNNQILALYKLEKGILKVDKMLYKRENF